LSNVQSVGGARHDPGLRTGTPGGSSKAVSAGRAPPSRRQLDTDPELGDRDRGDGRFVILMDQSVQVQRRSFSVDEHGRIEEQEHQ
jgi:hypothetical protein